MKRIGIIIGILLLCIGTFNTAYSANIKIGTGGEKGIYHSVAGAQLLVQLANNKKLIPTLIPGTGSLDNLEKMKSGELDAAFVQPDALINDPGFQFKVVTTFHPEYVHMIALKDKLKSIKDLTEKDTVAIGKNGGGTAVTWANFIDQDSSYKKIATIPESGAAALAALESGDVKAVLRVCGLRDGDIMRANAQKGKFQMIAVDDWDFNNKEVQGKKIYEFIKIDSDVYPNLFPGFFNGSAETITMKTMLIVSSKWASENSDGFEVLYDAAAKAVPNVLKAVKND